MFCILCCSPTEGRPTNLARSRMSSWSCVFCVAGKNVNFYAKNPIRSLIQADLGMIMRGRTSPLFGINQMLVSAVRGEGSSPSKNQVKIGSLIKLICERIFRMAMYHSPISINQINFFAHNRSSVASSLRTAKAGVQVSAKANFLLFFCLFTI